MLVCSSWGGCCLQRRGTLVAATRLCGTWDQGGSSSDTFSQLGCLRVNICLLLLLSRYEPQGQTPAHCEQASAIMCWIRENTNITHLSRNDRSRPAVAWARVRHPEPVDIQYALSGLATPGTVMLVVVSSWGRPRDSRGILNAKKKQNKKD